ncbi:N-acyl homoserine lactonase family protein [Dehalobacter sp. DCM]|uniref:N-acyl homoserine lactonase family protein n=1 Tax=Dehalobacter sp. DCM TaxID=2907827 RepID=UPI003081EF1B|nr:N-acyl homoserine lactonase family protein [Dehalobacter sp. DCM]
MKLYLLKSGTAPDMPREAILAETGILDPKDVIPIPTTTYLIDHPDGKVLYDTGWTRPERFPQSWEVPEDEKMVNSLAKIGVTPDDIKYVVCSHLHLDHAGNLDYFKNSEIMVSEAELTQVAKYYFMKKIPGGYIKADLDEWVRIGLKWNLVKETEEPVKLLDGISMLSFGSGHAFGMLGLLIELPKAGNIILTSDAIYCRENAGPPVRLPGLVFDKEGYIHTVDRIHELAKKYHAQIWFSHDQAQYLEIIHPSKGYYE